MAASSANLRQFTVSSVEGLDEGKERGRGCYGAVYEVRLHGLPCIAKRLHDILVGRGREERVSIEQRRAVIGRFREECILLSGLRHPNVVQFMGVHYGRDEADISLIMEYMHMDLDQCTKTYPNIPLPYKTSILRDVAYGLAYLHSIPIMHRDLNAGNVLLTESLRAKIADLGVAKLFDMHTLMHRVKSPCPGALDFMPPESFKKKPKYDVKLDVFSFGHLAIFVSNQQFPILIDCDITEQDVRKSQRQFAKRREALEQMGGPGHPLYSIAVQCLSDTPDQRPTSRDLVRRMEELCKKHPLPYRDPLQTVSLSEEISTMKKQAEQLNRQLEQNCVMLDSSIQENLSLVASKDLLFRQLHAKEEAINELTALKESVNSFLTEVQRELIEKKRELNKLKEEITVHQAQAQTFKEYFLKERSERERKHSDYCELQQTSSETIRRLEKQLEIYQIELQEEKKKRESAEFQRELEEEKRKIQHRTSLQNAKQAIEFSEEVLQMETPNPMVQFFPCISEQAVILQVSVEFIGTNTIKAQGTIQQLQKFGNYVARLHSHCFPQDSSKKLPWLSYVELPFDVHGNISSQAISQRPHSKTAAHPSSPLPTPLPPPLPSPSLPSPLPSPTLPSSALPLPPSGARVISNLSCDVLLLMPKMPYIITPGVQYRAYEERVFILGKYDQSASSGVFLEAYRKVKSSVKVAEMEVNAEHPREEIKSVVVEYNQRYKQCFFVFNEQTGKLKIISNSSRQFEQAKRLLVDMFCRPAVRAIEQFNFQNGCFVTVKKANLVHEKCGVIVNDANSQLDHDGGVASALNTASNGELQLHSNKHIYHCGTVPVGGVVQTKAGGNLKCKYVFHAVGPNASSPGMDDRQCYKLIYQATTRALSIADKLRIPSIAFPALSTGINGVSCSISAQAMLSAIEDYKCTKRSTAALPNDVRIVISDAPIHAWFAQEVVLRRIRSQKQSS